MTHGSVGLLGLLRSVFLAQGPSETLKRSIAIQQEREKVDTNVTNCKQDLVWVSFLLESTTCTMKCKKDFQFEVC